MPNMWTLTRYCRLNSPSFPLSIARNCSTKPAIDVKSDDSGEQIRNFRRKVKVPSILLPEQTARELVPHLKSSIVRYFNGLCFSREPSNPEYVHLLFDPEKVQNADDLGPRGLKALAERNITVKLEEREIELAFDTLSIKQLVAQICNVNPGIVTFGSVDKVGHIVVIELHEGLLPYKEIIGKIIIEKKKPEVLAVLNRVGKVRTDYRIFPMEVIAKDSEDVSLISEVEAMDAKFRIDFNSCFWNYRRHNEHQLISEKTKEGDVLYDVFAGVGPFCIPSAMRGCKVLANDFNPDCYYWLQENAKLNDVQSLMSCYQQDGHDFIKHTIKQDILNEWKKCDRNKNFHVVMNLPVNSSDFLASFKDWMSDSQDIISELEFIRLPTIHIYTFVSYFHSSNQMRIERHTIKQLEFFVGPIEQLYEMKIASIVSDVCRMYRISFQLPFPCLGIEKRNTEIL